MVEIQYISRGKSSADGRAFISRGKSSTSSSRKKNLK
jgi:hypothetical protein